ncbi:hypothetical protein ALO95_200087 [Pseudomonas syringae pv. antirrhini]|nr:hypothetical protein ALQ23_200352 [Pseudomonas syringae pv. antirrhini]RMW26862.1 hypothetical protein ALO95_200087 [Pseudomonas syringae pv. antirrhini]
MAVSIKFDATISSSRYGLLCAIFSDSECFAVAPEGDVVGLRGAVVAQSDGVSTFVPYQDQSLSRFEQLDDANDPGCTHPVEVKYLGWKSYSCPEGFLWPLDTFPVAAPRRQV